MMMGRKIREIARSSSMGLGMGSTVISKNSVASFLVGGALPTLLLLFVVLASDGGRVGEQLFPSITCRGHGSLLQVTASANVSANVAPHAQEQQEEFPGLATLLAKVATDDRTVIITSVNAAWAQPGSLLDLFRESFRSGEGIAHLLDHVLVVAVDGGGFERCKVVHPHCFLLEVKSADVSSANRFMTREYIELVWAKLSLQQSVLELGYNFLFTDADIVWFRNPFQHISLYADMAVSCDRFYGDPNNLSGNEANTGFYYVKSSNRTAEMLRQWRTARSRFPLENDQDVFVHIKGELAAGAGDKQQQPVRIVYLETVHFSGFCQNHDDLDKVCTMHANCCVGLESKLRFLRNAVSDWKNYTSLASSSPEKKKKNGEVRWTFPTYCLP